MNEEKDPANMLPYIRLWEESDINIIRLPKVYMGTLNDKERFV